MGRADTQFVVGNGCAKFGVAFKAQTLKTLQMQKFRARQTPRYFFAEIFAFCFTLLQANNAAHFATLSYKYAPKNILQ